MTETEKARVISLLNDMFNDLSDYDKSKVFSSIIENIVYLNKATEFETEKAEILTTTVLNLLTQYKSSNSEIYSTIHENLISEFDGRLNESINKIFGKMKEK